MKRMFKLLPHLQIALALVFLTFEVLDWYNPYMNFIGLGASSALLILFCCLAAAQSLWVLARLHRQNACRDGGAGAPALLPPHRAAPQRKVAPQLPGADPRRTG